MTHSGKLQNVTHSDIINMGMQFEADLKQRLDQANREEMSLEIEALKVRHLEECDNLKAQMQKQADAFEDKLREKESSLDSRISAANVQWLRDIESVIEKRCCEARAEEKLIAEEQIKSIKQQLGNEFSEQKAQMEAAANQKLELMKNEFANQTETIKKSLSEELDSARREIGKLKYTEMERGNYTDDLMEDIRERLTEKHKILVEELEEQFNEQTDTLRMDITKLEASLKEKEEQIERAEKDTEQIKKQREELKEQFKEYIHQTRPELIKGQIDFMFEF